MRICAGSGLNNFSSQKDQITSGFNQTVKQKNTEKRTFYIWNIFPIKENKEQRIQFSNWNGVIYEELWKTTMKPACPVIATSFYVTWFVCTSVLVVQCIGCDLSVSLAWWGVGILLKKFGLVTHVHERALKFQFYFAPLTYMTGVLGHVHMRSHTISV